MSTIRSLQFGTDGRRALGVAPSGCRDSTQGTKRAHLRGSWDCVNNGGGIVSMTHHRYATSRSSIRCSDSRSMATWCSWRRIGVVTLITYACVDRILGNDRSVVAQGFANNDRMAETCSIDALDWSYQYGTAHTLGQPLVPTHQSRRFCRFENPGDVARSMPRGFNVLRRVRSKRSVRFLGPLGSTTLRITSTLTRGLRYS